MRETEYIGWSVEKGNIKMDSAICYKNYIKKVEEIMGMDIEDIFIEDKKRDPFEVLFKEITTTPEHMGKSEKYKRSKWAVLLENIKNFIMIKKRDWKSINHE